MANRAYLIWSENDTPACSLAEELCYDPDTEVLCASSTLIPIYWHTLFAPKDMKWCACGNFSIPALVTQTEEARLRIQACEAAVLHRFAAFREEWQSFKELIAEAPGSFLKLDCAEIWDLEPEQFSTRLPAALTFWSSGKKEAWRALLALAEIKDKRLFRGYSYLAGTTPAAQMQGYGWVRPVPWKE